MTKKQMITASIPNVFFDKWAICDGSIDKAIFALQELKRIAEEQDFTQISLGLNLNSRDSDDFNVNIRGVRQETDKEFNRRVKQEKKEKVTSKKRKEQSVEAQKEMLRRLRRKYPDV